MPTLFGGSQQALPVGGQLAPPDLAEDSAEAQVQALLDEVHTLRAVLNVIRSKVDGPTVHRQMATSDRAPTISEFFTVVQELQATARGMKRPREERPNQPPPASEASP